MASFASQLDDSAAAVKGAIASDDGSAGGHYCDGDACADTNCDTSPSPAAHRADCISRSPPGSSP